MELLRHSLLNYRAVASAADASLRYIVKRYSALVPCVLPTLLCALGGLDLPTSEDVRQSLDAEESSAPEYPLNIELVEALADLARDAASKTLKADELTAAGDKLITCTSGQAATAGETWQESRTRTRENSVMRSPELAIKPPT